MEKESHLAEKSTISIVISGAAGQGIKTIESILMKILKQYGLYIFSCKEYMSRVRGGSNSIQIRVSEKKTDAWADTIDILLPIEHDLSRLEHRIDDQTIIIGEKDKLKTNHSVIDFSFNETAKKAGSTKYANVAAVGVILGLLGIEISLLEKYLEKKFARKDSDVIEANKKAGAMGYSTGKELSEKGLIKINMKPDAGVSDDIMVNGAQAVGMGAIAGGCNFIGSYPMSPSTGVLEFMAGQSNEFPIAVEQAEDEIAALNMVLGAWYAGARGMATTSGGGFALMGEAMSLSGITETPAVVHIAQRPGPGTGLPTRTEQGDLNLALYSGHGDFARAIFTPPNIEEAFYITANAFNVADKYQIPVIILTDQYLMDSIYNLKPWDTDKITIEKKITKTESNYLRYRYTDSGLTPRGIPGYGDGLVCVDSDEHDESGHITEDWKVRDKMMEKRMKRLTNMEQEALMPEVSGNDSGDIVVVAWGSSHNMIREALKNIEKNEGTTKIKYLHFSQIYPLNPKVKSLIGNCRKLVTVENNYTGQFGELLSKTFDIKITDKILLSNGFPFSVEYLTEKFQQLMQITKEKEA